MQGKVYLVGVGPGDPELITLKALRVLQQADVIMMDDLVNPALLQHARADAHVLVVGKRGGCSSTPQSFINRQMVQEARAGHHVARLNLDPATGQVETPDEDHTPCLLTRIDADQSVWLQRKHGA